ncbi:conserved hypothetical protein [Theileria equi strain WA]|uniref:Uncharacterized protein n=1 Tax=Theileria equi strain WA TaxID=1537102 RepID=L1LDU4_THEEQ|nr:conserved hypothetical protein [Theileria equi strain WA]EKX73449.1 conserved hypothetical protein [Theileria equi strain WA]|eukprot:XP_004832901.1 conserved hypothetical protein [Theileria equi strain WA]
MTTHRITYVGILRCNDTPIFLSQAHNLTHLSYLSRGYAKNISSFMAREIASRIDVGLSNIDVEGYDVYAYKWENGLCIICICNKGYPNRVAFALLQQIFFDFIDKYPDAGLQYTQDINLNNSSIKTLMHKYNNPLEVDAFENVSEKVHNTMNIVHRTVNDLLNNGETLEALVNQSKDLSTKTKDVFAKSKKLKKRSCCALM